MKRLVLFIFIVACATAYETIENSAKDFPGGWVPDFSGRIPDGPCNIEIRSRKNITVEEFMRDYVDKKPVVLIDDAAEWKSLKLWTKTNLRKLYSNSTFTNLLAQGMVGQQPSSNFTDFLDRVDKFTADDSRYSRTDPPPYIFDHMFLQIKTRKKDYSFPHLFRELKDTFKISYFSVGASLSGTFFHAHGPAATTTIFGKKRIFAIPPKVWQRIQERMPGIGLGRTSDFNTPQGYRHPVEWFSRYYDKYYRGRVRECVCGPGHTLYIPDKWGHGVINIGETVGVAIELRHLGESEDEAPPPPGYGAPKQTGGRHRPRQSPYVK